MNQVLRFAVGSDITRYFTGELDINGRRHKHSGTALSALRPLVKWKLRQTQHLHYNGKKMPSKMRRGSDLGRGASQFRVRGSEVGYVFRDSRIVEHEVISEPSVDGKYLMRLCIALKKDENSNSILGTPLTTSTFIFQAVDPENGQAFERPYNSSACFLYEPKESRRNSSIVLPLHFTRNEVGQDDNTVVYKFFITLVPGGKMSTLLSRKKPGKHLMVKGPLASKVSIYGLPNRRIFYHRIFV